MNPSEDPNDRLLDSLLREQARGAADEELLQGIESRLEAGASIRRIRRRPMIGFLITAAAALLVLGFVVVTWRSDRREPAAMGPLVSERNVANGKPRLTAPEREIGSVSLETSPAPTHADALVAHGTSESKADHFIWEGEDDAVTSMDAASIAPPTSQEAGSPLPEDLAGGGYGIGSGIGGGRPPRQRVLPPSPSRATEMDALGGSLPAEEAAGDGGGMLFGRDASAPALDANRVGGTPADGTVLPATRKERLWPVPGGSPSRENYGRLIDQPWKSPWQDALSTFSVDVDTASYANLRRMILEGRKVPADAVRIEELVNYFDYGYEGPQGDGPFAVHGTLATCPWKPQHLLARVAIKGREIETNARPASNLVFLIDVSGSMQDANKLPLLKRSMRVLLDQLDERDRLGIVVYAGSEGVVLDPTTLDERGLSAAIQAVEKLEAGGSTNGGAGIKRAYEMAAKHLAPGGVNRVILATDGDFNVGTTGQGELVSLVKKGAAQGVNLSVLGFGTGNLNDAMMEAITNDGNGNYFYIDGDREARRVFLQKLTGTLVTIAKDVKIQVEFNPGKVQAYRLIGYANRILRHEDFNNDKVDAGDIGAGHTVTAFYEIVPPGVAMPDTGSVDALRYQKPADKEPVASDDWFTLKLRYKHPEGDVSQLIESPVKGEPVAWEQAGGDFRFASSVALFGMKLREMPEMADTPWQKVVELAGPVRSGGSEQRAEFVEMVARHGRIPLPPVAVTADPMEGLAFLRAESTMWYVQFGLESQGKWAPRFTGRTSDGRRLQNRVSAVEMMSPGDVFFKGGEFAGRFRYLGMEEREITSERTGLTQMVKIAHYEDLKPNKVGTRYESQAGLPDAELSAKAYYDRIAVLKIGGREIRVEEGTRFGDASGNECFLKSVSPERVEIEFKTQGGETVTREVRK